MKSTLTLPSLANKIFIRLRDEDGEQILTYTDPFLRHFVRQSILGNRRGSFNQ